MNVRRVMVANLDGKPQSTEHLFQARDKLNNAEVMRVRYDPAMYSANYDAAVAQGLADRKKRLPSDFNPKDIPSCDLVGDKVTLEKVNGLTVAFAATKGRYRPTMEDYHAVWPAQELSCTDTPSALERAYDYADGRVREYRKRGGSTANTMHLSKDFVLTLANAGDTEANLLIRTVRTNDIQVRRVNRNHRLDNPLEMERVRADGGKLTADGTRIQASGGVVVVPTRGFGNLKCKGFIHAPEISQVDLNEHFRDPDCEVEVTLVIACDGLFENLHMSDFAELLMKMYKPGEKMPVTKNLVKTLKNAALWSDTEDNVTVGMMRITEELTGPVGMGVYDGHGGKAVAKLVSAVIPQFLRSPKTERSDAGISRCVMA
jgi:serine/threonine protein phosphatase PrpC